MALTVSRDDAAADGGLHQNLEELAGMLSLSFSHRRRARTPYPMCNKAQRVHLIAVEQHIDLHQLAAAQPGDELVVKRGA